MVAKKKTAKKATARKTSKKRAGRRSRLEAAAKVLAEAGRPMSCPEMVEAMAEKGYGSSPAPTSARPPPQANPSSKLQRGSGGFRRAKNAPIFRRNPLEVSRGSR